MEVADESSVSRVKKLLSGPEHRIALDDLVTRQTAELIAKLDRATYPLQQSPVSPEAVQHRLDAFGAAVAELGLTVALIGRWAEDRNMASLRRIFTRLSDHNEGASGMNAWVAISWFPFMALSCIAGVAALSADRYDVLAAMDGTRRGLRSRSEEQPRAFLHARRSLTEASHHEAFKLLPKRSNRYSAMSDYVLEYIAPPLRAAADVGAELERLFDRFEILQTLSYISESGDGQPVRCMPGRFGWKHKISYLGTEYAELEAEATALCDDWPPSRAGMFRGSTSHFIAVAKDYRERVLDRMEWY